MRLYSFAAAIAVLTLSLTARADDIFTLNDATNTISFQVPSSPTVASSTTCQTGPDAFCLLDVPVTVNGTTATSNYIAFYDLVFSGGLTIEEAGSFVVSQSGPVLFVGPTSAPTFQTGSFDLTNFVSPAGTNIFNTNFNLTITSTTIAQTPEPSSFALLGTGLMGVAGVLKRRFA